MKKKEKTLEEFQEEFREFTESKFDIYTIAILLLIPSLIYFTK